MKFFSILLSTCFFLFSSNVFSDDFTNGFFSSSQIIINSNSFGPTIGPGRLSPDCEFLDYREIRPHVGCGPSSLSWKSAEFSCGLVNNQNSCIKKCFFVSCL